MSKKRRRQVKLLAKRAEELADELYLFADFVCRDVSPAQAPRIDQAKIPVESVARDLRGMK